jgi:glycosyltransferase involved in cell wall biosynthesis
VTLLVNDEFGDEINNGVRILSLRHPRRNRIARALSLGVRKEVLKKARDLRADIYHIHDPELLGLGYQLKKSGCVVVYDSHEDVPRQIMTKEWLPKFARPIVSRLFELYENRLVRCFNAVIVPTPHIRTRFRVITRRVWEVCNFPALDEIVYSEQQYSNLNPACYVGDLSVNRGILQIAEATKRAGVELYLCGEFTSEQLKTELLSKYEHVRHFGILNRVEVARFLVGASMGFVTLHNTSSYAAAYPIKMFEYMAAGIPVIASNFPVYKAIVEGSNCGICVDPLDVDAIADAVKLIRSDRVLADRFRSNGRKAVTKKYSWESQASKLLDCYYSITANDYSLLDGRRHC